MTACIKVLRISPVNSSEEHGKRVYLLRHHNQMHVIGHQTVGQYSRFRVSGVVANQSEVHLVIGRREEHPFSVRASLGHVIREPWQDASGISWHFVKTSGGRRGKLSRGQTSLPLSCIRVRSRVRLSLSSPSRPSRLSRLGTESDCNGRELLCVKRDVDPSSSSAPPPGPKTSTTNKKTRKSPPPKSPSATYEPSPTPWNWPPSPA
jgi:hypothetical protein